MPLDRDGEREHVINTKQTMKSGRIKSFFQTSQYESIRRDLPSIHRIFVSRIRPIFEDGCSFCLCGARHASIKRFRCWKYSSIFMCTDVHRGKKTHTHTRTWIETIQVIISPRLGLSLTETNQRKTLLSRKSSRRRGAGALPFHRSQNSP